VRAERRKRRPYSSETPRQRARRATPLGLFGRLLAPLSPHPPVRPCEGAIVVNAARAAPDQPSLLAGPSRAAPPTTEQAL